MSFSLCNLSYESRQRLHEIATPLERYRLQRAACSSLAIGRTRQPVTTIPNLHSLLIMRGSSMLVFSLGSTNADFANNITSSLKDDYLLRITKPVSLWLLKKEDFDSDLFEHLALETGFVSVEGCRLDRAFVDCLAEKVITPLTNLSLDRVSYGNDFTFGYVFDIFPKLEYLKLNLATVQTKWVQKLVNIKGDEFKDLDLIGSPNELLDFETAELFEFMRMRHTEFSIRLICRYPARDVETINRLEEMMKDSTFFEKCERREGRSIRIDIEGMPPLAYRLRQLDL
uniref:FTH domain-containing protein n=1 Tax=Panagrellus redivivus TaxID=6233 RepID=A0A7E4ZWU0_PANRE